jgi:transposase
LSCQPTGHVVGRPNKLAPYLDYLRERIATFPDLTAVRLTREIKERGYSGAYTAVKRFVSVIRPQDQLKPFEVRFETPPGHQAQVDFARFVTTFTDEPEINRIVWLFSLVLGHSRYIFARFVMHQTCSRCCAVTCWPSAPLAECRSRSFTTA